MMDYSSRQGYYATGLRFDQPPGVDVRGNRTMIKTNVGQPAIPNPQEGGFQTRPYGHPMFQSPYGHPMFQSPYGYPMFQSPYGYPMFQSPYGYPMFQSPYGYPMFQRPYGYRMFQSPYGYPMFRSPYGHPVFQSRSRSKCDRPGVRGLSRSNSRFEEGAA